MQVKTFWLILLKVLGITLVLRCFSVIINSVTTFSILSYGQHSIEEYLWIALSIILTVAVYLFILWLFVFKTSWLVDKLHLEKGFQEERIELDIQFSNVLTIAIIVIGGIMLVNSLPQLCKQIFSYFQMKSFSNESQATGWIILYSIQTVLGYLLMANSKPISNFIAKKANSDNEKTNEQSE